MSGNSREILDVCYIKKNGCYKCFQDNKNKVSKIGAKASKGVNWNEMLDACYIKNKQNLVKKISKIGTTNVVKC